MNAIDLVVIIVVLGSGLFAMMRGFVHEVLAMVAWVIAPLAGFWSLPYSAPLAQRWIAQPFLAEIAAGFVVFLAVLLLCSIVTHAVARRIQCSETIGSVDRTLGFGFGAVRGLVLCCLLLMAGLALVGEAGLPNVVTTAKTRPILQFGTMTLKKLLPERFSASVQSTAQQAVSAAGEAQKAKEMFDLLQSPKPRPNDAPSPRDKTIPAYDSKGLQRLIENGDEHGQSSPPAKH